MTEFRTDSTDDRRMADVSHTHPYTDRGAINRPFERGPVVAADGGERDAVPADDETDRPMKEVDHTPPHGDGANPVFQRGEEDDVAEEE